MPVIVFVPGILGSRLALDGDEVWPPSLAEAVFGHRRPEAIADPRTTAGAPIDRVACFDVYGSLLDDLAAIAAARADGRPTRVVAVGYDWRDDLDRAADRVAETIEAIPGDQRDEIRLVGHSMGCLVLRLLLDCGGYDDRAWFPAVRGLVTLAAPHRGTPTALVRALGLEGSTGLSGSTIRDLARTPGHSALYALLPAPGEAALCEVSDDRLVPLDLWDPAVARRLDLDLGNLAAARTVHDRLARGRPPAHVATLDLAGTGSDGWARIDLVGGRPIPRLGRRIGDGTVPLWSAVAAGRPHHAAPGPHEKIFRNDEIRTLIRRALGAAAPARPFGAAEEKPELAILPARPVFPAGRPIELMLVANRATPAIEGDLLVERTRTAGTEPPEPAERIPISIAACDHHLVRLPVRSPGFWRVDFSGSHRVGDADRGGFVVAAPGTDR